VIKKLFFSLLFVPLVIIAVLLLTAYWLVATESGTQWLVNKSSSYVPNNVVIGKVEGRLYDDFVIKQIRIINCDKTSQLNDIHIVWNAKKLFNKIIEIQDFTLGSAELQLTKSCEEKTKTVIPDAIHLPIEVLVQNIQLNNVTVNNESKIQHIENIKAGVTINHESFVIENFSITAAPYQASALFRGKLQKPFASSGKIKWNFVDENKNTWQGEVAIKGDINEIQVDHVLLQPLQVVSKISLFTPLDTLSFVANNQWTSVLLPLGKAPQVTLENGEFDIQGDLSSFTYKLTSKAKSQHLPSVASIAINGVANQQEIGIENMHISSADGAITGAGKVILKPSLQATLSLQGMQINPEFFVPELPGKLDFIGNVSVSNSNQGPIADIDLEKLSGTLRDYNVKGNGKLHYSANNIQAKNFKLAVGDNIIKVNGLLGTENNQADFEVTANNLAQLYPELVGNLQGSGSLIGSIKTPQIRANLSGGNIKYAEQFRLETFSVNGDVYVFGDHSSNASVQANNLYIKEDLIDSIKLTANGNQKQHQLVLAVQSKEIVTNLNLSGGYIDQSWNGLLNQLQANIPEYGNWKLTQASNLQFGPQGFSLSQTCLRNEASSLCIEGGSDAKANWQSQGKLTELPLKLLAKDAEERYSVDGNVNLEFNLRGNQTDIEGDVKLIAKNASIRSAFLDEFDESLHIQQFELLGDIRSINSKFDLKVLMDKGQATGIAQIENIQDFEKAFIRQANFNADIPSLKFLNIFIPNITVKEGVLKAQAQIHGYVKQPEIESNLKLSNLAFYIPDLGTEYTHGEFTSSSNGWNNFNLIGSLQSQEGKLELAGKLNIKDEVAYALDLQGDDFQVLHLPDKSLLLSPKLAIKGGPSSVDIQGEIIIPKANLILKELPQGFVTKTSDEVFVSDTDQEIELTNKKKLAVTGKIQIKFGEMVHFEGKGMKTDLAGKLLVRLSSKKNPTGEGVLKFNNATYEVLGQTLNISSGKMLFTGPLTNPELDVKVSRTVKEVTAGMAIEGSVKNPKTRVYSNPAMSDGNALSYLISGKPLNEASGSQNAVLAKAALSLGVDNSASLTQQIATTVGLDEIDVGGGDQGLESTSLILGKYLSPKLFISYAYGLFSSVGTVGLDYQLTKKISVEAESGEAQAIDLIYTIERN
jgi:translocation and assembly module TamB